MLKNSKCLGNKLLVCRCLLGRGKEKNSLTTHFAPKQTTITGLLEWNLDHGRCVLLQAPPPIGRSWPKKGDFNRREPLL